MTNLNDFFSGDNDVDPDAKSPKVLPGNAAIPEGADVAAPCYVCYRNDCTEFRKSNDYDTLDVRCTRCNVEYKFKFSGLWRLLGI